MDDHDHIEPISSDGGSDYEPSLANTSYMSVTESVKDHVWEYGRRYHKFREGKYPLPNDDAELDREEIKHVMFMDLLDGRLFVSPIGDSPQSIIDLGTGSGQWATEVGEHFPSAHVIGVDLSPVQPVWLPSNVQFLVDDIEDKWPTAAPFDLVHMRGSSSTLRNPRKVMATAFNTLRPGGWIELQEFNSIMLSDDNSLPPNYSLNIFWDRVQTVFRERLKSDLYWMRTAPAVLADLGFVNVQVQKYRLPVGTWAKSKRYRIIGALFQNAMEEMIQTFESTLFRDYGYDKAETAELMRNIQDDMQNRRIHAYLPFHVIFAQKPVE